MLPSQNLPTDDMMQGSACAKSGEKWNLQKEGSGYRLSSRQTFAVEEGPLILVAIYGYIYTMATHIYIPSQWQVLIYDVIQWPAADIWPWWFDALSCRKYLWWWWWYSRTRQRSTREGKPFSSPNRQSDDDDPSLSWSGHQNEAFLAAKMIKSIQKTHVPANVHVCAHVVR